MLERAQTIPSMMIYKNFMRMEVLIGVKFSSSHSFFTIKQDVKGAIPLVEFKSFC